MFEDEKNFLFEILIALKKSKKKSPNVKVAIAKLQQFLDQQKVIIGRSSIGA